MVSRPTLKPRVLFVDDEPNVLDGIRRRMRSAIDLDCHYALSGAEALQLMEVQPIDVVFADLRMPVMDGAELLAKVRTGWPHVVRIVASGNPDRECALRVVDSAHQFFAKPCDLDAVVAACRRSLGLRRSISSPPLVELLARLSHVPSPPALYAEITAALTNPRASVRDIAALIERDIPLSLKLLQLVNSSFFGSSRTITSVHEAVVVLGIDLIRALAFGAQVFSGLAGSVGNPQHIEAVQQRGLRIGVRARRIGALLGLGNHDSEAAFLAGFAHVLGSLLLLHNQPTMYARSRAMAIELGIPIGEAEERVFGASGERIAAVLLATWGLPDAVVEAVAYLRQPRESTATGPDAITCVHLAAALADDVPAARRYAELDDDFIRQVGLGDRLAELREAVVEAELV